MSLKIEQIMSTPVSCVQRHHTVAHARDVMKRKGVHALPVVDAEGSPVGIISSSDLIDESHDNSPLSALMAKEVVVVPRYADVTKAARAMLKHGIHHLVVTHEKEVVGVLSSMDLVRVLAEHKLEGK